MEPSFLDLIVNTLNIFNNLNMAKKDEEKATLTAEEPFDDAQTAEQQQPEPVMEAAPKYDRFAGKKALTVVTPQGQTLRRKRAIDMDLSELILPPYTKGVVAVYRLLSSNMIDPSTGEKPPPRDLFMEGSYVLYDKYEPDPGKKSKLRRNLSRARREKDKEGNERIVQNVEEVVFIQDECQVDVDRDYPKYCHMELCPLNKSNKHRDKNIECVFERVDIVQHKSSASIAAELDFAKDAEDTVLAMKDKNEIIGTAVSAGVYQPGLDPGAIKNALRMWARQNPLKFFKMNNNLKPAIKLNILDALKLGILAHDMDRRSFILSETSETIFTYLIGKDPIDEFTNALSKPENQKAYESFINLIDYWDR